MAEAVYTTIEEIPELRVSRVNFGHIALAYRRQRLMVKPRTAKTKRIGELAYSGRKLFRQKGTGFARQGERGNPHMRGGAVPMGPLPVLRKVKVNKKVRQSALHSAVRYHLESGTIKLLQDPAFESLTKTRDAYSILVKSGFTGRGIVAISEGAPVLRALRNIAGITVLNPRRITVSDLVNSNFIIFTENAFKEFREFLDSSSLKYKAGSEDKPEEDQSYESATEVKSVRNISIAKSRRAKVGAKEDE